MMVCDLKHKVSDVPLGYLEVGIRFGGEELWFLCRSVRSGLDSEQFYF